MKFTYICKRVQPNDLEKKAIEKIFKENIDLVAPKNGNDIILPHKNGAIFFDKKGSDIEITDFVFTRNIINIE